MSALWMDANMNDDTEADTVAAELRKLTPIHAAVHGPGVRIARLPGRPPRARLAPDYSQRTYYEEVERLRASWVSEDALVQSATSNEKPTQQIDHVLAGLAEEIASLRFEQRRISPTSREFSIVTSRIVDGLSKLASVALVRAKCRVGEIDPHGREMQFVHRMFVEQITTTAQETLDPETAAEFTNKVKCAMPGWEARADAILRGG